MRLFNQKEACSASWRGSDTTKILIKCVPASADVYIVNDVFINNLFVVKKNTNKQFIYIFYIIE